MYIKIYLKTGLIWPFKSFIRASILFDKKEDNNFYLYRNYWGLNNITIKNQYPLSFINKLLSPLD